MLNRFSKDIGYMDDQLQVMFSMTLMVCIFSILVLINSVHSFAVVLLLLRRVCISYCCQLLEHIFCHVSVDYIHGHTLALCHRQ